MKELFSTVIDIGEEMLISGAEIHRVEDSINRMGMALGAKRVACFSITSSMVVTFQENDGSSYTETRRIWKSGTNFHKLDQLNALSRHICEGKVKPEMMSQELERIKKGKVYPHLLEYPMYAAIAASFTVFFGGGFVETVLSGLLGLVVRLAVGVSNRIVGNAIFAKFFSSLVLTALAYVPVFWGVVPTPDNIIIGNIMPIVPGLGFTNALRDIFTGDSVAGILRLLEATLSAVAIAGGYFVFIFLTGGVSL